MLVEALTRRGLVSAEELSVVSLPRAKPVEPDASSASTLRSSKATRSKGDSSWNRPSPRAWCPI
jgi:hypothetical protein